MARLIWTEPALNDLNAVAECIALDKPEAARRFIQKVFRVVDRLARFPRSGPKVPELPRLPYRQVVVPPCRILYRIDGDTVLIVYVFRGERPLDEETLSGRN
jgi:plasmid stabilization system protein ParE